MPASDENVFHPAPAYSSSRTERHLTIFVSKVLDGRIKAAHISTVKVSKG
jgi:hypothetical protein